MGRPSACCLTLSLMLVRPPAFDSPLSSSNQMDDCSSRRGAPEKAPERPERCAYAVTFFCRSERVRQPIMRQRRFSSGVS
jgi:hypothetical protein